MSASPITHLMKPGCLMSNLTMRCGLPALDAGDGALLGAEDGIAHVDCLGCLHNLIADLRAEGQGLDSPEERWIVDGDTGTSSITIWSVMTGRAMPTGRRPDIPHDPEDFVRCINLLEQFPAWRERLPEVAAAHPEWAGLVGAWAELEELLETELPTGQAPLTYARMKGLQ